MAFLTAWLFAFSMLSNCYCSPVVQSEVKAMSPHCSQHSSKTKNCAPRVQIDQFEKVASQIHFETQVSTPVLIGEDGFDSHFVFPNQPDSNPVLFASPPPQIYLLHHTFLI